MRLLTILFLLFHGNAFATNYYISASGNNTTGTSPSNAWTSIAKPVGTSWTSTNPQGKEQYDQVDITYDSATTYYDGTNPAQWTGVVKPTTPTWTKVSKPI